jgi:hypothetical protein
MSTVVLLMVFELSRGISNYLPFFKVVPEVSQYMLKDLAKLGCASTGDVVSSFFNIWNDSSQASFQTYFVPFFKSSVIGLEILEKFRTNLR